MIHGGSALGTGTANTKAHVDDDLGFGRPAGSSECVPWRYPEVRETVEGQLR